MNCQSLKDQFKLYTQTHLCTQKIYKTEEEGENNQGSYYGNKNGYQITGS